MGLRESIPLEERLEKSRRIEERLLALTPYHEAATLHLYLATRSEVMTEGMVRASLARGKRVVVPVVNSSRQGIELSEIRDYDRELSPGYRGILEPVPSARRPVSMEQLDLMVLPLVAFDSRGHRIGYGAGYYDKLLSGIRGDRPVLVGLAYEMQEVENIAEEAHDVSMDWIVTEDRVIQV
ncbi:MAG: 5-formyltetrahydrofolate cyclo-ligase [Nitrospirae bacterium]|nr:5-formyltetrahydrofolate cyclo-ligase [Nitrospirota bacterium]